MNQFFGIWNIVTLSKNSQNLHNTNLTTGKKNELTYPLYVIGLK